MHAWTTWYNCPHKLHENLSFSCVPKCLSFHPNSFRCLHGQRFGGDPRDTPKGSAIKYRFSREWKKRRYGRKYWALNFYVDPESNLLSRHLAVQRMYQNAAGARKEQFSRAKYAPDAEFHEFLGYVETNNVYQVRSRLRDRAASGSSASRLVVTAEEKHGNTPLHRAVSLGFVETASMLLEAGADVDAVNVMGDAPIHCCWRFWKSDTCKYASWRKNPYLMVTKQMKEDFARMVRT